MVACAWDGQTYIIDHNRTVVRFQVDENIRAFCAGGILPRAQHTCPLAPVTWGEGSSPERSCLCSPGLPLRQELGKHPWDAVLPGFPSVSGMDQISYCFPCFTEFPTEEKQKGAFSALLGVCGRLETADTNTHGA